MSTFTIPERKNAQDIVSIISPNTVRAPGHVLDLLRRLHAASLDQEAQLRDDPAFQSLRTDKTGDVFQRKKEFDDQMRDKFIALVPDKAVYLYNQVRASGALNVVECGTSFGASTIWLALAVAQNAADKGKSPGEAKVIATEMEPGKIENARQHWAEAGKDVEQWIELREGDLTQTLKEDLPVVDFVLFDIWSPMVMPTLRILEPKLRSGAVLLTDNTISSSEGYKDFFQYIKSEGSNYTTTTLPFEDGLELTIYR